MKPDDGLLNVEAVDDVSAFSPQISDFKTPIVLDTGSGVMKAGFADEELPAVIFPTVIGLPKYEVTSADQVIVGQSRVQLIFNCDSVHLKPQPSSL